MTPADLVLRDVELLVDGATLRGRVQLADEQRVYVLVSTGCGKDDCGQATRRWYSREPHEVTVVGDLTTAAPPPPAGGASPASA